LGSVQVANLLPSDSDAYETSQQPLTLSPKVDCQDSGGPLNLLAPAVC